MGDRRQQPAFSTAGGMPLVDEWRAPWGRLGGDATKAMLFASRAEEARQRKRSGNADADGPAPPQPAGRTRFCSALRQEETLTDMQYESLGGACLRLQKPGRDTRIHFSTGC